MTLESYKTINRVLLLISLLAVIITPIVLERFAEVVLGISALVFVFWNMIGSVWGYAIQIVTNKIRSSRVREYYTKMSIPMAFISNLITSFIFVLLLAFAFFSVQGIVSSR